ncbi:hypothetical protein WISP_14733 [Willisornis vidua]|uniref:Uncharacterized protein n=1 Tax=Willisornis vidua TaxID=1566151 RepID=A0ABQ9DVV6_9PASS|nr:hypothetical protein WISP_14733 [Willisornis vidua]
MLVKKRKRVGWALGQGEHVGMLAHSQVLNKAMEEETKSLEEETKPLEEESKPFEEDAEDDKKSLATANSVANFNVILITIMENGMKNLRLSAVLMTFYERVKKDTADYGWSDEIFVINQRGGEMKTVSFQISNSVAEITGLPKDDESSAYKIKLMLDIQSCQLRKMRCFDGCLTMI